MYEIDYIFLFLFFFFFLNFSFPPKVIWRRGRCIALTWSGLYTCQRYICFLLSKVNNQSHLITVSHVIVTSTKGYKKNTFELLTKKLNKQVYSLQKQCSFYIFLTGTGTDPCFRYQDSQEWQQYRPQSPKLYSLSHTLCKSKKIVSQCLTLSCDDVP